MKPRSFEPLTRLASPHDETELLFYMNSISDGTTSHEKESSPIRKKMIEHSGSDKAQSVVLQYLRLSFLAYNKRPSKKPLYFTIAKIRKINKGNVSYNIFEVVGSFITYDSTGETFHRPMKMKFSVEGLGSNVKGSDLNIYLYSITVDKKEIFGWWYSSQ